MRLLARPMNPVLARELKERMRTRRATVVVVVWLALVTVTVSVVYQARAGETAEIFNGPLATQSAAIGRTVFDSIVLLMLTLVLLVVPGLTADAITGERERQTLVPLQVTLLRPRSIVAGKLLASIAFVTLLTVLSTPMLGIAYVLGGVDVADLLAGTLAVIATAVLVATISIFCSSVSVRTQGAVVLSLFLVLLLAVGGPLVYLAQRVFDDDGDHPPVAALLVSPYFATAHAVGDSSADSPLSGIRGVIEEDRFGIEAVRQQVVMGDGRMLVQGQGRRDDRDQGDGIPFWLTSTGVLAAVAALAFAATARRLRTPNDRTAT